MKQWKRLAALSSAIVMAAATLTYFPNDTLQNIRLELSASAETTTEPQVWIEDNLTWTLDADGTLTISGTGAMKDYNAAENLSPAYMNSDVKKVEGMKVFKRIKWSYVVLSAMFLLLGIYLVVNPETSLVMICRILGAAMAVFGVMKIVLYFIREVEGVAIRFDFAVGLFCIILGALMLWRAPALTDILSVMIGLLVLVDSVFKLQVAVDSRRMGAHSWWVTLVCTVVCLVLGILLVFNPFDGKQVLTIMMGVSLIVDGVQNLCTVVYAAIFVKDVKAAVHDFVDDATAVETTGEVLGEDAPQSKPDEGPKAP